MQMDNVHWWGGTSFRQAEEISCLIFSYLTLEYKFLFHQEETQRSISCFIEPNCSIMSITPVLIGGEIPGICSGFLDPNPPFQTC